MKTPENKPSSTVYINNLSYERDRNGIKSMFAPFGKILNIKIVVEPSTNQSRGMAFVEMSSLLDAKKAIEGLDQKIFDGRTVKARYATPLKSSSVSRTETKTTKKPVEKDLAYKDIQLAKKARNEKKRSQNPFFAKLTAKKANS